MVTSGCDRRRNGIMQAIVDSYVKTVKPVSSRALSKEYRGWGLSSATIRNVMADLENMGYLTHPYTSAGRIPTDLGYRYYVNAIMELENLGLDEITRIEGLYKKKIKILEDIIEETTKLLSELTHQASLVLFPKINKGRFKQIEFIPLDCNKIMIVFLSSFGLVKTSIVELGEMISKEQLQKISNFLNYELHDMNIDSIEDFLTRRIIEEKATFFRLFRDTLFSLKRIFEGLEDNKIYLEGTSYIFGQPEFSNVEKVKNLLKVIDQKKELLDIMLENLEEGDVTIRIGSEINCKEIHDCSIVVASYKIKQKKIGTLGVLGPKRMEYAKVTSIVKHISKTLSRVLTHLEE